MIQTGPAYAEARHKLYNGYAYRGESRRGNSVGRVQD